MLATLAEFADGTDEEAETAMWSWYLEWSTIARTVINNRRHLRELGFLQPSRSREDEPEPEPTAPGTAEPESTEPEPPATSDDGTNPIP